MEIAGIAESAWRCEGALYFQRNRGDVIQLGTPEKATKTVNSVAVFIKKENDTTPVCHQTVNDNKSGYNGFYTVYPCDVNRRNDGTPQDTILSTEKRIKIEEKGFDGSLSDNSEIDKFNFADLKTDDWLQVQRRQSREETNSSDFENDLNNYSIGAEMIDLKFQNETKNDHSLKTKDCIENRMKWAGADVTHTGLDVDMENISLENDLPSLDSYFNMKKESGFNVFQSSALLQDNFPVFNNTALNEELQADIPFDLSSIIGTNTTYSQESGTTTAKGLGSTTDNLADNSDPPKVELGAGEIQLLTEALRTRSFAPIAYLLSLLTKYSNGFMSDTTADSRKISRSEFGSASDDELSNASSFFSDYHRRLSSQDSYDSDHSSVLSDGKLGKRFSEGNYDEFLKNGRIIGADFENQRIDMLTLDDVEKEIRSDANAYDERGIKNEKLLTTSCKASDIVGTIEDMLRSNNECDLEIFKELLEKDGGELAQSDKSYAKIWKEAGTETFQFDKNRDRSESDKQLLTGMISSIKVLITFLNVNSV